MRERIKPLERKEEKMQLKNIMSEQLRAKRKW